MFYVQFYTVQKLWKFQLVAQLMHNNRQLFFGGQWNIAFFYFFIFTWCFFLQQEHIYKLMKSDSYSRFIRSSAYQELLQAKKKVKHKA